MKVFDFNEQDLVKKYLGVPFKHLGRSPKMGLDCYGLIKCFFGDLGIELIDVEDYKKNWSKDGLNYFLDNYYKQFIEVPVPHPFDVVLFKNDEGVANHAGIVLSGDRFIHTSRVGTVVARLNELNNFKRIVGFYRIKQNA